VFYTLGYYVLAFLVAIFFAIQLGYEYRIEMCIIPFIGLGMFLAYLNYIALPARPAFALSPPTPPADQVGDRPAQVVFPLVIILGMVLTIFAFLPSILLCIELGLGSGPPENTGAEAAVEIQSVQTAIFSMMADKYLVQVKKSTSGPGGEKIDITSGQFHLDFNIEDYLLGSVKNRLDGFTTRFCYRWDASGEIIFQSVANANGGCAGDARQY
jgi:hypothetical protein